MQIKLMDSSIRDGGNVNDWQFGKRTLKGIIEALVNSGVDVVELGYLKNVEYSPDKSLYNTVSEAKKNIPPNKNKSVFSLMVQEDKWDWNKIEPCDGSIPIIRVSFHKTDIQEGLDLAKLVMKNGYICHCNPINIMGYSDAELLELIERINEINPDTFTIVDTFGSMEIEDLKRICFLLDNNLKKEIKVSAHLHENLGLAYSLAQAYIEFFESRRPIFIDASLNGIGRVPGNLCIELIMRFLLRYKSANYDIDYIYDAIDDYITPIKSVSPWGYSVAYALSAAYNLHRTYPEYLLKKDKLKTKDIRAILESIVPEEKVIYNEAYIRQKYESYMRVQVDDLKSRFDLAEVIRGKNILVLAPGSSINQHIDSIKQTISEKNCIVFSINFLMDNIKSDYVFFTSSKRYGFEKNNLKDMKVMMTSNLLHDFSENKLVFDFDKLSHFEGTINTDSVLIFLNLIKDMEPSNIFLAGFDGFSGKNDYFDTSFGQSKYLDRHTAGVKTVLDTAFDSLENKMQFVTPSIYC